MRRAARAAAWPCLRVMPRTRSSSCAPAARRRIIPAQDGQGAYTTAPPRRCAKSPGQLIKLAQMPDTKPCSWCCTPAGRDHTPALPASRRRGNAIIERAVPEQQRLARRPCVKAPPVNGCGVWRSDNKGNSLPAFARQYARACLSHARQIRARHVRPNRAVERIRLHREGAAVVQAHTHVPGAVRCSCARATVGSVRGCPPLRAKGAMDT